MHIAQLIYRIPVDKNSFSIQQYQIVKGKIRTKKNVLWQKKIFFK